MRSRLVVTGVFLCIPLIACAGGDGGDSMAWQATRDTVGDTIIVRTTAGSVWGDAQLVEEVRIGQLDGPDEYTFGSIVAMTTGPDGTLYVLDQQVPALRTYAADGTYLGDLGREGEGPGELKQPDSGLAALDDGRVLVRDPGNARITVFGADGEHETEWRIRGSSFTSTPLYVDDEGRVYVQLFEFGEDGPKFSFVRHTPDGVPVDTIPVPRTDDAPRLTAVRETDGGTSRSTRSVPFWPTLSTELSKTGEFVVGDPAAYSIDVPRADGVLRIQRAYEPVAVDPGERDNTRERVVHNMRRTEPGWDWDGPAIPDAKPAFRNLMVDDDGRIWTHLYTAAEPIPAEEIEEPGPRATGAGQQGADEAPPLRWREPVRFDVFDRDGTYLGQLEAPRGFQTYPRPTIAGDTVWAVVEDELDVPYVVRFRIVPEPARP